MKNTKKLSFLLLATLLICLLPDATAAAPIIEINSPSVDIGKIREGETKKVRHIFVVRNKGDENLIISKVKAG